MTIRPPVRGPRHDDRRRTYPALGARSERAGTWWGDAWIEALEELALDPARLARGRAYAAAGHVDAITVTPGRITAYVHGSRPRPYRTELRLRTLPDQAWEEFLDTAAAAPAHIAALLDKDLPHALADEAALLPGSGDLIPDCSCPDDGYPCKHAAALCYQTGRLLDEDPFVLLLMRGRGEQEVLAALTRRNATRMAVERVAPTPQLPTVQARTAVQSRTLPPLPPPFPAPPRPGHPPAFPAVHGGPDPLSLDLLATEAAIRAHTLLTTGEDPTGSLSTWQDAVRLAAVHPGSGLTSATRALYTSLARGTDRTPADLARAVAAWRQGGMEALAVLETPWDPPAGPFDRARPALTAAGFPDFRPSRNRLSTPTTQLRYGRDGLWYGYESDPGRDDWWPRGTPDADPVGALTARLGG
ncbi:SWIM zinc finger family protein [Streptomyces sp. NBC_01431]|uniref:SWIM zinc finger family protein n=1 Tax=Streptomyces sp. NBC_01431 TaxID=2903863 RepID=UPI002E2FECA0|nr:SWIM zinc finger family protein [Streptomyces sp. NBC_01431]